MNALDVVLSFERFEAAVEDGLVEVGTALDGTDPDTGTAGGVDDIVDQTFIGAQVLESKEADCESISFPIAMLHRMKSAERERGKEGAPRNQVTATRMANGILFSVFPRDNLPGQTVILALQQSE